MITCKLGDKTYTVDFIAGRALREMGPALKVYSQIAKALAGEDEAAEKPIELADGLDVLVGTNRRTLKKARPKSKTRPAPDPDAGRLRVFHIRPTIKSRVAHARHR